ncbi:MAG: hypothetical protein QM743_13795 [Chitinophagaceae bacterium]
MRFDTFLPVPELRPYVRHFAVSESGEARSYRVFPETGLVMGLQYRGSLFLMNGSEEQSLHRAGITGITDRYRTFRNAAGIGTILVYFTETGFASFGTTATHELYNLSTSLEDIFGRSVIAATEEHLNECHTDAERISVTERFLLSQLQRREPDRLVAEAVRLIRSSGGTIRIRELNEKLYVSQSPLEKRFRSIVGTSPKKFASIVRFQSVLRQIRTAGALTDMAYEYRCCSDSIVFPY